VVQASSLQARPSVWLFTFVPLEKADHRGSLGGESETPCRKKRGVPLVKGDK